MYVHACVQRTGEMQNSNDTKERLRKMLLHFIHRYSSTQLTSAIANHFPITTRQSTVAGS